MCCQAKWKREAIPDHKFDFIDTAEFHTNDWLTRFRYVFVYVFQLKNLAIVALDIYTASTMIASSTWTNVIYRKCGNDCAIKIPFGIAKWVFVGCIAFGFLLLAYETWKARKIVRSRDIAFAYTSIMANDYYSLRSYDTFCFFCQIGNSTKKKDEFAFFVFFTFKDWKRLLLSDGPRQAINACTLYSFAYANDFQTHDLPAYWDNSVSTLLLLLSMIATVALFACSLLLMITAAVCYVPLVCYIQGNLKEYCCHKVDKRIGELLRHRQRLRVRRQLALEKQLGNQSVLKDKNGKVIAAMTQPTLPTLDFTDDDEDMRMRTERIGRRKSIARFARSLSRKVKRTNPQPTMDIAANEAGVGLPPVSSSGRGYPRSHNVYPLHQGYFGGTQAADDLYGSRVHLAGEAAEFAGSEGTYPHSTGASQSDHTNQRSPEGYVPEYYAKQDHTYAMEYPTSFSQDDQQHRVPASSAYDGLYTQNTTSYPTAAVYAEDAYRAHSVQRFQLQDSAAFESHSRHQLQPF